MPYSSEYFEPVRGGYFTAQGFVGIYKKARFDLGGQQVMCFIKWESLVEFCFYGQQITAFQKWESMVGGCVWEERKLFLRARKVLYESVKIRFSAYYANHRVTPNFPITHVNFPFPPHQYNMHFPISSAACGGKHALQLRFPQNPILRLIKSFPFAPVQSLKAVSDTESYNFYKKYACVELWTEVAGR